MSFKSTTSSFLLPGNVVSLECAVKLFNFLIDESFNIGKGANPVISMVHFYLKNHGLNSVNIHLNVDNCTGQNKNNTVIQVSITHAQSCTIFFINFSTFYGES